jgi:hypothetical protein
MASPVVTGISALLLQQYRITFPPPSFSDPRPATLKAVLATTAGDLENVGPDFRTGFGLVNAPRAVALIQGRDVLEAEIGHQGSHAAVIQVGPGTPALKVTLAWDDPPASPNVSWQLVNDLDLKVIAPDGTVHHPWTLDPENPATPAVRTVRDGINNIEQVTVDMPSPGTYVVEVRGVRIALGTTQRFSIAATPALDPCSSTGALSIVRERVRCADQLGVKLLDCDLNTNPDTSQTAMSRSARNPSRVARPCRCWKRGRIPGSSPAPSRLPRRTSRECFALHTVNRWRRATSTRATARAASTFR